MSYKNATMATKFYSWYFFCHGEVVVKRAKTNFLFEESLDKKRGTNEQNLICKIYLFSKTCSRRYKKVRGYYAIIIIVDF